MDRSPRRVAGRGVLSGSPLGADRLEAGEWKETQYTLGLGRRATAGEIDLTGQVAYYALPASAAFFLTAALTIFLGPERRRLLGGIAMFAGLTGVVASVLLLRASFAVVVANDALGRIVTEAINQAVRAGPYIGPYVALIAGCALSLLGTALLRPPVAPDPGES